MIESEVIAINEETLKRLITEYQPVIFSICYRLVRDYFQAEDLTQETFLAAYKSYERFDGKNEKAWLARIATNKCLDYLKSKKNRNLPAENDVIERTVGIATLEDEYFKTKLWIDVEAACNELKEPYRSIACAYYIHGASVAEIAKQRGEPKKTISTRIYRARQLLKLKLKEVG